ncbi:uncharacterized protein [Antedon mediterranea]|uniref:uncharacterized protein n=1 Tax=Antedon mediterranea TaxID=105859 RepID=UPI003AF8A519
MLYDSSPCKTNFLHVNVRSTYLIMNTRNPVVWGFLMISILNVAVVFANDDCPEEVKHGERNSKGEVTCNTGYNRVECSTPTPAPGKEAAKCELDVVSLSVAVALMVFLVIVSIILFSIIIRRYKKRRSSSQGAMYMDSNDYVTHDSGMPGTDQDGYRRKDRENGGRVIEITAVDGTSTSNDFKYHEQKDEIEMINAVSGGYSNDGMFIDADENVGAVGGYDIDETAGNNRMVSIEVLHDNDNDVEIGFNQKSSKDKKNKGSKKNSKVKKSADKSKQKNSSKLKKKKGVGEPKDIELKIVKERQDDDVNEKLKKIAIGDNISADGLYQSMEELNGDVAARKDHDNKLGSGDDVVAETRKDPVNKLSSTDADVAKNTEVADNDAVYAQVDRKHLEMKKLKRQLDSFKQNRPASNNSPKPLNNISPFGSHTTGSDEGYGEEIEAV